ncbi:MAG: cytochrome c biogenesis protein CcdA [Gaiellaceae bacterium]
MDVGGLSLPLVFLAGTVSFISPCVLPLVPGYLATVSGVPVALGVAFAFCWVGTPLDPCVCYRPALTCWGGVGDLRRSTGRATAPSATALPPAYSWVHAMRLGV